MKNITIIISLFLSSQLSASTCDHHLDRRKEALQAAKHAQTAAAAAAVAVVVLCPFCILHAVVASAAVSGVQQEFEDEAEEQLQKYKNCERALSQEDRDKLRANWDAMENEKKEEMERLRKHLQDSMPKFNGRFGSMHGMGQM